MDNVQLTVDNYPFSQIQYDGIGTNQNYWTSTEASASNGVNVNFNTNGNVNYFNANNAKTNQYYVRPANIFHFIKSRYYFDAP